MNNLMIIYKLTAGYYAGKNLFSAIEKSIVPWKADSEVSTCFGCEKRFNIARRRHHCRLCGDVMCNKCSHFMSTEYASA